MLNKGPVTISKIKAGDHAVDMTIILNQVLEHSAYGGEFEYDKLMLMMSETEQSGSAIGEDNSKLYVLFFVDGEPEGASFIDNNGILYGDKAVFVLKKTGILCKYRLFITDREFANSIAARCRVYDKNHLNTCNFEDLPVIGGQKKIFGELRICITAAGKPKSGMRVTIREGRKVLGTEVTASDGKAYFRLRNGTYDCSVMDRQKNLYHFKTETSGESTKTGFDICNGDGPT